jgi:hypothetical protein
MLAGFNGGRAEFLGGAVIFLVSFPQTDASRDLAERPRAGYDRSCNAPNSDDDGHRTPGLVHDPPRSGRR